jgi:hypothetical protein
MLIRSRQRVEVAVDLLRGQSTIPEGTSLSKQKHGSFPLLLQGRRECALVLPLYGGEIIANCP